jgi:hypothetical protein
MSATKPAGALAIGAVLLASTACGFLGDSPCEHISSDLVALEKKSHGQSQYSSEHAPLFRETASKVRDAAKDIEGSTWADAQPGKRAANEIATDLEKTATKLSGLPPGERAVYLNPGRTPEDLPRALTDSCGIPTDRGV